MTISMKYTGWNNVKDMLFLKESIFNITKDFQRDIYIFCLGLCFHVASVKILSGILYLGLCFHGNVTKDSQENILSWVITPHASLITIIFILLPPLRATL